MSILERAAFLRGLIKGLDIDDSTPERKIILALVDLVEDMAYELTELADVTESLEAELDEFADYLDEHEGCCSHAHGEGNPLLDLQCPACGNDISIDEPMLAAGRFPCPYCGENLEIGDIGDEDEEESDLSFHIGPGVTKLYPDDDSPSE
ncbi:hypothetical protein LJC34_02320 [Oscillospiraceae bacterium OttesenSCG-928-G22]|nr:hypothetical protein [Oscillospiraceae bacterium OttesenSCG-928-G22]